MKKKLLLIMLLFLSLLLALTIGYTLLLERRAGGERHTDERVLLNEIRQLTANGRGDNPAQRQLDELEHSLKRNTSDGLKSSIRRTAALSFCATALFLLVLFLYLYVSLLRPFDRLEGYAQSVASGNLNVPLEYERTNFFGAFTWAFDHMREEIQYAKKNEARAVNENKTVIATLSHDIKTPIASIRAYAEGLEANLDATFEQRERYVRVILKKCDEVTRLTNDLVLHSLSELERLEVKRRNVNIGRVLKEVLKDLEDPHIELIEPVPNVTLLADEKRMAQILENLLSNALKYAPETDIAVWAVNSGDRYRIHVRDHGGGIPPEDMPFVFDKFYRGRNVKDAPGSGLGLYIVKYILNRLEGDVTLINHSDGLEAVVWLPIV